MDMATFGNRCTSCCFSASTIWLFKQATHAVSAAFPPGHLWPIYFRKYATHIIYATCQKGSSGQYSIFGYSHQFPCPFVHQSKFLPGPFLKWSRVHYKEDGRCFYSFDAISDAKLSFEKFSTSNILRYLDTFFYQMSRCFPDLAVLFLLLSLLLSF